MGEIENTINFFHEQVSIHMWMNTLNMKKTVFLYNNQKGI